MRLSRKFAWISAALIVFAVLFIQFALPQTVLAKTKIDPDSKTLKLKYNTHIDSRHYYDGKAGVDRIIYNNGVAC